MNAFNRIVVGILLIGLLVLAVVSLTVSVGLVPPAKALPGALLAEPLEQLATLDDWQRAVAAVIAGVIVLSAVALLVLEIRPKAGSQRPFLIREAELGALTVERLSVAQLAERVMRDTPGVIAVRAVVYDGVNGIRFRCRVTANCQANLTELGPVLQESVKKQVEQQLGLTVEQVVARLRLDTVRSSRPVLK